MSYLSEAAIQLLDTADQTGCTPDLVVVESGLLRDLAKAAGHDWRGNCETHLESCDDDGFCNECGHQ